MERLVAGVLLPHVVLVVGMALLMNAESRAGAAEFAALGLLFMLLAALPVTLVVDLLLALSSNRSGPACFAVGMLPVGLVLVAAKVYHSGLWDRLT